MDPRGDYFGLGQAVEQVRLIPLTVERPACAFEPGAVIRLNPQGQWVCVNPEFLPEDRKPVPSCASGTVPVLDSAATAWSCQSLRPGTAPAAGGGGRGGGGGAILAVVGAAVLLGAAWLLLGRR